MTTSQPSAVSWGSNRIDVFTLGADYAVWHNAWNGSAWSSWHSLGGMFTGRPTAVSAALNQIDVFAVDANHTLQHKTWNGSTWGDWTSMELQSYSTVKACSSALNQVNVFALGNNSSCWYRGWNGFSWTPWVLLGGLQFETAMDAVCFSPTSIQVFGLGFDSAAYSAAIVSPSCKSEEMTFPDFSNEYGRIHLFDRRRQYEFRDWRVIICRNWWYCGGCPRNRDSHMHWVYFISCSASEEC